MITQHGLLQKALASNAVFSLLCGVLMLLFSAKISSLIGVADPIILIIVGLVLVFFSLFVMGLSRNWLKRHSFVWFVINMDFLWVLGTALLVSTGTLTAKGNILRRVAAS